MKSWEIKPARDIGLPLGQRLRSLARERGLVALALNATWRHTLRLYLAAAHRLEVTGRENLPPPPFVIIANHTSHLDALTLAAVLRGDAARAAHALAAGEVFFGKAAGAAFAAYAINALPVWRGRTQRSELKLLRERLQEDGMVYILFPEGTRSRDGAMAPFQPGLAMLVAGTPVPVVPCWIEGAHACWPASSKLPRPGKLRLRIGAPLVFADVQPDAAGRAHVAASAQAAVQALKPA